MVSFLGYREGFHQKWSWSVQYCLRYFGNGHTGRHTDPQIHRQTQIKKLRYSKHGWGVKNGIFHLQNFHCVDKNLAANVIPRIKIGLGPCGSKRETRTAGTAEDPTNHKFSCDIQWCHMQDVASILVYFQLCKLSYSCNVSDLVPDLSWSMKVKRNGAIGFPIYDSLLCLMRNLAHLQDTKPQNLSNIDLTFQGHSRIKIKCDGASGLSVYGFLLMFNGNIASLGSITRYRTSKCEWS